MSHPRISVKKSDAKNTNARRELGTGPISLVGVNLMAKYGKCAECCNATIRRRCASTPNQNHTILDGTKTMSEG